MFRFDPLAGTASWGSLQTQYSVSVFQSVRPPRGAPAMAGNWPVICKCNARWHRPACAREMGVST